MRKLCGPRGHSEAAGTETPSVIHSQHQHSSWHTAAMTSTSNEQMNQGFPGKVISWLGLKGDSGIRPGREKSWLCEMLIECYH